MSGFGGDLQSLPVDLHPEILAHVPLHGLARLALTSHAWHRAVEAVTAELTSPTVVAAWLRAAVEAPEGAAWLVSWV